MPASYFIVLFDKPGNHRAGAYNRDIKRLSPLLPNITSAMIYLSRLMAKYREPGFFMRIDKGKRMNPVAYADLNEYGGIVRFKDKDGYHWSPAISLAEFRQKLARRVAH